MTEYTISIDELQKWTYQYKVKAKSSEEALSKAESLHFAGVQSFDDWLNESEVTKTNVSMGVTK